MKSSVERLSKNKGHTPGGGSPDTRQTRWKLVGNVQPASGI